MRGMNLAVLAAGLTACLPRDPWGEMPNLNISPEVAYNGSGFSWAPSPGSYAPKFNQRKARKQRRRRNKK